jgi:hypothetical protein
MLPAFSFFVAGGSYNGVIKIPPPCDLGATAEAWQFAKDSTLKSHKAIISLPLCGQ